MNMYDATFKLGKRKYRYVYRSYNCGFPMQNTTERVVELALADYWLSQVESPIEIGAVTPYYWPNRVPTVIDPCDAHPFVTHRISLFYANLTDMDVLSISTIEHIGTGNYGINEKFSAVEALQKLLSETKRMLVTFPAGMNQRLDGVVYGEGNLDEYCKARFMVRNDDNTWSEVDRKDAWREYTKRANSVAILEKGGVL